MNILIDAGSSALTALYSVVLMFISAKVLGYKQISQLTLFDYINGITIGSVAAELSTADTDEIAELTAALFVYTFVSFGIMYLTTKSIALRRFFNGKTIVLLENGKLYKDGLRRAGLEINEFLTECRALGYFHLDDVETAMIEPNGKLSVLPKSSARAVTPRDLDLDMSRESAEAVIISDGKIMDGNLRFAGFDRVWLEKKLAENGFGSASDVFLALCVPNDPRSVKFYRAVPEKTRRDMFE